MKKCLRPGRKYSSEGRDDDGLFQNGGDRDGEVGELRSKDMPVQETPEKFVSNWL